MLFNSFEYMLFLPLVLVLYFNLRHRQQNWLLLLASYLFYGLWDWRFLSLIWISTGVDYCVGLFVANAREQQKDRWAKAGMLVSLCVNLGILGYFKYANFFVQSAESALSTLGLSASWPLLNIILPVGISFYTFQTLSYTLDIYKGELQPTRDLLTFALFVAFFPQLVAGPIERAQRLLPQLAEPRIVTQEMWDRGIYLILIGLIRKVAIADTAGATVERILVDPSVATSLQLAAAILLYTLQIYGDFAGYSNIARGTAMLLGVDLVRNFHHPYFAVNISDFWRRWHISLTTWFRDYVYIPLGGNRQGESRTYVNVMVTMLLSGLWHGASWNFVLWGGLHGLYMIVYRVWRKWVPEWRLPVLMQVGVTFTLATLTWVPFRIVDFATMRVIFDRLLQFTIGGELILIPLALLFTLILLIDLPQAMTDDEFCFLRINWLPRTVLASLSVVLLIMMVGNEAPFIYFQF